jgi:peptide/nickel transport system substrate-binding protein
MGLSFLLVASLVLAGCGPAVEEEEEEVVEPAAGTPQYGGTIIWGSETPMRLDPPSPSITVGSRVAQEWMNPIFERPFIADFETFGPRGTGEYSFQLWNYIPENYLVGNWLESWEVYPDKLLWHIRPGVMWSPNPQQQEWFGPPREVTAEDAVLRLKRWSEMGTGKALKSLALDIYADGNTVVIETARLDSTWLNNIGIEDRTYISPPEMVEQGDTKWENQVGTGPFWFEEYVVGSYMSFVPNPIWRKTTTIDGVEYKIPFIDRLIFPVIPDAETRIAALTTGALDVYFRVPWDYQFQVEERVPELQAGYEDHRGYHMMALRSDKPPFEDLQVRRAISIGTDRQAFRDQVGLGETVVNWSPFWAGFPETIYTPFEKLPADVQEMLTYDPDKAIQMLADAGYPDGFTMNIYCNNTPYLLDGAQMFAAQMEEIGVETNFIVGDTLTIRGHQYGGTWDGVFWGGSVGEVSRPVTFLTRKWLSYENFNYGGYADPALDARLEALAAIPDLLDRYAECKELGVELLGEAIYLPVAAARDSAYMWPWVKNWYGELNVGDWEHITFSAYVWLDQDLKEDMGY